jgi:fatty acid desaturase
MTAFGVPILGWLAAGLTLATFVCRDMRRLRLLALAANAAFIGYGTAAQLLPVLVLHLALVPVNLWRLNQAFRPAPARSAAPGPSVSPGRTAARRRRPRSWRTTSAIPSRE